MTRKLKITPVLISINILVILVIISFYMVRMYKYYKLENTPSDENTKVTLYDEILKHQSLVDQTKGLVYDEKNNIYRYIGNIDDNYIKYNGILFRIVEIDNFNNIKIVSENNVTLMYNSNSIFDKSFVNKWLNKTEEKYSGVFENNLYDTSSLENTASCSDIIDDLTKITCSSVDTNNKISLLSLYDYSASGGKQSYLNNKETYYLSTTSSKNVGYYVAASGDIGLNDNKALGVRPVLTLNGSLELLEGKGTKDNPYVIEKHDVKNIKDAYVGSYIKIKNDNYRIINIENNKIKVIKDGIITDENKKGVLKAFSSKSNVYAVDKKSLGYYLNNDYYNTLNKNLIVKSDFYVGSYLSTNLDYTSMYSKKINTFIALPSLSDMFINDVENIFLLNPSYENNQTIYTINNTKNIYKDLITNTHNIRPVFYIKKDNDIVSGTGTKIDPYVISEVQNEK